MVVCCALIGCATWSEHGITPRPPEKLRLAVLPIQSNVRIKRLSSIETISTPTQVSDNDTTLIRERMQSVTAEMTRSLEGRLKATEYFDVVPSQEVQDALESLSLRSVTSPLTSDQVKTLGETLHVQAVLITTLSGYGRIKTRWQAYLIGSGVVEGVTEGVIAARVVHNVWVAVGVGLQEILQEVLTWGGGVFLFDKFFTPVILESEVVSTIDGKPIWQKTAFARINRQGLKTFPTAERGRKEVRLRMTAEKAEEDLVKSLQKTLIKNIPRT